jgi:superfamily II DNA or RNA helicase
MTGQIGHESGGETDTAVAIEWRGRDLALVPPPTLAALEDAALLAALLGPGGAPAFARRLIRDRRGRFLRFRPLHFADVKAALLAHGAHPIRVAFEEWPALPFAPELGMAPRPYQEEAIVAWRAEGSRGVVVLPTGGGKTLVGAMAIADAALATLVVVPTIDLLAQWRRALLEALTCPEDAIGVYGGGEREARPITIITYESAALHPEFLRRFGLLIFDECHHLPAPTYRQIAEGAFTPLRLGLSATPERADEEHLALESLIGPEVYRRDPAALSEARYLAEYDERQMLVALGAEERLRY